MTLGYIVMHFWYIVCVIFKDLLEMNYDLNTKIAAKP